MSSRPQQAGRGAGRGRGNMQPVTRNTGPGIHDEFGASGGGNQEEAVGTDDHSRVQRRDAYTMIAPKPGKRENIAAKARQEEENFQRYKEQKKCGTVNYVGTPGGGAVTEDKARQRTVNQNKQASFNQRQKSQQYREETRRKENQELNKMKNQQRTKADQNMRRDSARQQELKKDHRARNEAFLQKLETEAQQKRAEKILTTSAAASFDPNSETRTTGPLNQGRRVPDHSASYDDDATLDHGEELADLSRKTEESSAISTSMHPMDVLQREYPGCDSDFLEGLLLQCNGRIDKVRQLIDS